MERVFAGLCSLFLDQVGSLATRSKPCLFSEANLSHMMHNQHQLLSSEEMACQ